MSKKKPIKLSDYLRPEMVWLDVPDEPIEFIGKRFCEMSLPFLKCKPEQWEEVVKKVNEWIIEREKLGSSAIGNGVAIPYAGRFGEEWLDKLFTPPVFGIGISEAGLSWRTAEEPPGTNNTLDNMPVHIIAYQIFDVTDTSMHLVFLAKTSRLLMDKFFRQELRRCKTREKVIEVFRAEEDMMDL